MTDDWISAETEGKEADFRGILAMHVNICKGILRRQTAGPYLYVDLYAGPGHLEFNGRRFLGSPPFEWVARLVAQAREAGCRVHLKPNLVNGRPGMTLPDEYPGGV